MEYIDKGISFGKDTAESSAKYSTCYKYKVGAVISQDGRIISTGYNGTPSKIIECCEFNKIMLSLRPFIEKNISYFVSIQKKGPYTENWYEKGYLSDGFVYNEVFEVYKFELMKINSEYIDNEGLVNFGFNMIINLLKLGISKEDYMNNCNVFHSDLSILGEVHAEENAIAAAAKWGRSTKGCSMIVTHLPCPRCARLIKQSGITKVYYTTEYINRDGQETKDFFLINNIKLSKI